jgi:hypothetical protein
MKQTAVEWLATYLKGITSLNCDEVIEKAKAMEKEQIINAYDEGEYDCGCNGDSEQYYNETFKK